MLSAPEVQGNGRRGSIIVGIGVVEDAASAYGTAILRPRTRSCEPAHSGAALAGDLPVGQDATEHPGDGGESGDAGDAGGAGDPVHGVAAVGGLRKPYAPGAWERAGARQEQRAYEERPPRSLRWRPRRPSWLRRERPDGGDPAASAGSGGRPWMRSGTSPDFARLGRCAPAFAGWPRTAGRGRRRFSRPPGHQPERRGLRTDHWQAADWCRSAGRPPRGEPWLHGDDVPGHRLTRPRT
jgi:hypothetical protein